MMVRTSHFLADAAVWLKASLDGLRQHYPEPLWYTQACRQEWDRRLCAADLIALTWPEAFGGRGLPVSSLIAFHALCAEHGAPQPMNTIAHAILAPTLLQYGSAQQKQRFLPGIRRGSEIWCQGYSEPQAGSDLAAVRTRAVASDAGWTVNGHKIWTTQAHLARWCFALVRTDPAQSAHQGLSFMVIDMHAHGVRVEPIRQMTGEADYNEIQFVDVALAPDSIIGRAGEGWRIAMAAAEYERGIYFLPRVTQLTREIAQLRQAVDAVASPAERAVHAQRLQALTDRCRAIQWRVDRVMREVAAGNTPGVAGAMLKLMWSETRQQVWEQRLELLGEDALVGPQADGAYAQAARVQREFLWSRAETIVAGTSEIQRNIIGERALGLPKDRKQHG